MQFISRSGHLIVIFLLPLLVYLGSMPLTVTLEDDGLFILSSYFNGVSHSPGYPIHSLIGHLFSMVPVSTVAARVHAVSAVFGALTCVALWFVIFALTKDKLIAILGSLSYAFSTMFWSQAIIAEVYTLNTVFFFYLLFLTIRINQLEGQPCNDDKISTLMYATAFVFGLSLSNSWPLILLSSPAFLILVWPTIKRVPRVFVRAILFALAGLLPYAWMVINSQTDPLINFMGPIDTWSKFYYFVSREIYAPVDNSETSNFADKFSFCVAFIKQLADQYTYAGCIFVIIGVMYQLKYFTKHVVFALIAAFLGNSLFLIVALGFDYNESNRAQISVYYIVPYGIAGLWMSLGVYHVCDYLKRRQLLKSSSRHLFVYLFVVVVFISHVDDNYRRDYNWAEVYATQVLESLPEDVNFILAGQVALGAIGYMHHIKGVRQDVTLVTDGGVLFREKIFDPFYRTPESNLFALLSYIKNSRSPVYTTIINEELYGELTGLLQYDYWLTRSNTPSPAGSKIFDITQIGDGYIDYIYGYNDDRDAWTSLQRKYLIASSAPFVLGDYVLGESRLRDLSEGKSQMIKRAGNINARGKLYEDIGDEKLATTYYKESIQLWPNMNNESFIALSELYQRKGRKLEYNEFLKEYDDSVVSKYTIE